MKTTIHFYETVSSWKAEDLFWEIGSRENITIPEITCVQFFKTDDETRVTFAYTNAEAAVAVYEAMAVILETDNDYVKLDDVLFPLCYALKSHKVEFQCEYWDNLKNM